jgi:hypothetical protein
MGRRKTMGVVAGLVILATAIIGGTAASGDTAIHVFTGLDGKVTFVDRHHDGLTFGDRLFARGPIFDAANPDKKVGNAYLDCWVAKNVASGNGLYHCTYLLHFADGDLTLEGLDPPGPGSSDFVVTGGDRAYRGATGDAVFTDTDITDMQITLVD